MFLISFSRKSGIAYEASDNVIIEDKIDNIIEEDNNFNVIQDNGPTHNFEIEGESSPTGHLM